MTLPTNGGNQDVLCLKLDFVPLWLAKISITPTMSRETPELADRLEQYQLKAKDVLAAAFLPQNYSTYTDNSDLSPMLQTLINIERRQNKIEAAQAEQNNKIHHIDSKVDNIRDIVAIHPDNWRNECKKIVSLIAQKRGGSDSYKDTYSEIYNLVDMRANVKLDTRLKNMRSRMEKQGEKKSVCDRTNKIDVIAKDKKLKEIYIAIVKEFAIKYGVDDIPMPEDEELY